MDNVDASADSPNYLSATSSSDPSGTAQPNQERSTTLIAYQCAYCPVLLPRKSTPHSCTGVGAPPYLAIPCTDQTLIKFVHQMMTSPSIIYKLKN